MNDMNDTVIPDPSSSASATPAPPSADAARAARLEKLRAPLLEERDAIALAMLRACAAGGDLPGVPATPVGEPRGPFRMLPFSGDRFDWFAAGDVHGDLPALVACADAAVARARPGRTPVLAILGDLVDRGEDSIACMLFVLRLALGLDKARPGLKVLFVRGDHDEALRYDEKTGEISSGVRPAELAERFRGPEGFFAPESAVVHAFVRFVEGCPAAVYLDNGTLLFHGGVPQGDLLPHLGLDLSLQSPECAQDFAWCRIEDVRRKRPSRATKTAEEGAENVRAFLEWFDARLAAAEADPARSASLRAAGFAPLRPVAQIVRGHTHVTDGYLRYARGPVPIHTVNSFHAEVPFADPVRPALVALRENAAEDLFASLWPEEMAGLPVPSTEQTPPPPRASESVPEPVPARADRFARILRRFRRDPAVAAGLARILRRFRRGPAVAAGLARVLRRFRDRIASSGARLARAWQGEERAGE